MRCPIIKASREASAKVTNGEESPTTFVLLVDCPEPVDVGQVLRASSLLLEGKQSGKADKWRHNSFGNLGLDRRLPLGIEIERLANELDMSSSTFHSSFKAVTDTSPLQYIKDVRLHKARTLMIQDGLNANIAAIEVGYESSSQFNREYKRLFGVTPAKDATTLRGQHMANP